MTLPAQPQQNWGRIGKCLVGVQILFLPLFSPTDCDLNNCHGVRNNNKSVGGGGVRVDLLPAGSRVSERAWDKVRREGEGVYPVSSVFAWVATEKGDLCLGMCVSRINSGDYRK